MATRVKVCGVTRPEDAALAGHLGAWAVGMIFVPGTPRHLGSDVAGAVARAVPAGTLRVGVFCNERRERVQEVVKTLRLDLVQLHGEETPAYCRAIGLARVIKAVTLRARKDVEGALAYDTAYLLADRPKPPPSGTNPSSADDGSAAAARRPVDAGLARALARAHPRLLLAGGLAPDNVARAMEAVAPWGVDVASGVEAGPGAKNPDLLTAFFEAVRAAEHADHGGDR